MNTGKFWFLLLCGVCLFVFFWNLVVFWSEILCMEIFVSAAFWVGFVSLFASELRQLMERRDGFSWPQQLSSIFSGPRWPAQPGERGARQTGWGERGGDVQGGLGLLGGGSWGEEWVLGQHGGAGAGSAQGGVRGWGQGLAAARGQRVCKGVVWGEKLDSGPWGLWVRSLFLLFSPVWLHI